MRDYIAYARAHCHPLISDAAAQSLIERYLEMRRHGAIRGQVSAYPRQLESLIRLSEACTKIRLAETVTVDDVAEAHRLYKEALKQSAVDPITGCVDVNILAAGAVILRCSMWKKRCVARRHVGNNAQARARVDGCDTASYGGATVRHQLSDTATVTRHSTVERSGTWHLL